MSRFEGDGRVKLEAPPWLKTQGSMRVTRSVCRMCVKRFDALGASDHSSRGAMLWVILEHCLEQGIAVKVEGSYGLGFRITRSKFNSGG